LAGHGILFKAQLDVQADLNAGRVLPLLNDWQGENAALNLLCPHPHSSA
jgi:hypothetical protein